MYIYIYLYVYTEASERQSRNRPDPPKLLPRPCPGWPQIPSKSCLNSGLRIKGSRSEFSSGLSRPIGYAKTVSGQAPRASDYDQARLWHGALNLILSCVKHVPLTWRQNPEPGDSKDSSTHVKPPSA